MATKNYFKEKELACPCCDQNNFSPDLLETLNRMREMLMAPLFLNSAYRCTQHDLNIHLTKLIKKRESRVITFNEYEELIDIEVKKQRTSSHIKGLATDLRVNGSNQRFMIVNVAREYGINRIGIAKTFIHVDKDIDKPQNLIWLY